MSAARENNALWQERSGERTLPPPSPRLLRSGAYHCGSARRTDGRTEEATSERRSSPDAHGVFKPDHGSLALVALTASGCLHFERTSMVNEDGDETEGTKTMSINLFKDGVPEATSILTTVAAALDRAACS